MLKTLSSLVALTAPLCLVAAPEVELTFAVEDGTSLTLSSERVLSLDLQDASMSLVFDGEEQEGEAPEIELSLVEIENLVFTDAYEGVEEGRPTRVVRTFDTIGTTSRQTGADEMGEEFEEETPGSSELEGLTVAFEWSEEDEAFTAAFAADEEEADEDLLEDLEARADFTWYLPEGEVSEGDSWDVPLEAFRQTSALSGDLAVVREGEEDDPEDDFGEQFDDNLAGEISASFAGMREEDGRELAVLKLSAELSTSIEQTSEIEMEEGPGEGESTDSYEFDFELEGELLWDLAAGHAVRFELAGDCEMQLSSEQSFNGEGHEITFLSTQDFGGEVRYEVELE